MNLLVIPCLALVAALAFINPVFGQTAELLTVGAVRQALLDVIKELNVAIEQASSQVKGAGNSLQANAQNVIADIDRVVGSNVNVTFDRLDKSQKDLVENAKVLITRTQLAVDAARKGAFQDAKVLINEADITAYNTSYGLPCRNQEPRFVSWAPDPIELAHTPPTIKIRGNFLNFGSEPEVTVDDKRTKIIGRNDTEMVILLDEDYTDTVLTEKSVTVKVRGLSSRERKQGLLHFLFGCGETIKVMQQDNSFVLAIKPRLTYSFSGKLWAEYKREDVFNALHQDFYRHTGGHCDAHIDVSQPYCIDSNSTVENFDIKVTTINGPGTYAGPAVRSGSTCVNVPALIAGHGQDCVNLLVGKICNCKGNGWVGYTIDIKGRRKVAVATAPLTINETLPYQVRSKLYDHPDAKTPMIEPIWKYELEVISKRGTQVIATDILSNIKPSNELGWTSKVEEGRLSVAYPKID